MNRYQSAVTKFFLLACGLSFAACSSSPMKERLDKNFVFNCSLELIKKNVTPTDAEKICTASHQAEMQENQPREQQTAKAPAAPMVKEEPPAARTPASAPADAVAPVAPAEAAPSPAAN